MIATNIEFNTDSFTITLTDGKQVTVPYSWSDRLNSATDAQRRNYEWVGKGFGIHWPDVDEDLRVGRIVEVWG